MRLLVIEDQDLLRRSLVRGLSAAGYTVDAAADGDAGWALVSEARHDLVVLDRMLPGLDGLELLRRLRRAHSAVPVLMLTARDAVADRVEGLTTGADDYLVKPFAVDELLARIQALLRRGRHGADPVQVLADLEIDTAGRRARRAGRAIDLTPREFAVLEHLLEQPGAIVAGSELARRLYGTETPASINTIEVVVARLRRKLHLPGLPTILHTRRGFGYQLGGGDAAEESS